MSAREGFLEKGFRFGRVRGQPAGDRHAGRGRAQRLETLPRRSVDQVAPVEVDEIEEKRRERNLGTKALHVELAAEAPHGLLEGQRPLVGTKRDDFPVQDHLARGQRQDPLHDFGHRHGDVVQEARVDAHVASRFVDLDPRAVDLVFQRRFAETLERFLEVLPRLREHRLKRPEEPETEPRETRAPFRERGARHPAGVSGHHHGAPDFRDGDLGGLGQRLLHEAGQRSLAQLAQHEADQKIRLLPGRALKERSEEAGTLRGRARSRDGRDLAQGLVHVQNREGRGRCIRHADRFANPGAPQAQARLARTSGEKGHSRFHLLRLEPAQQSGEQRRLLRARAGRRDPPRRRGNLRELHDPPRSAAGISISMARPPEELVRAVALPPCRSTISRTIARPRPEPPSRPSSFPALEEGTEPR